MTAEQMAALLLALIVPAWSFVCWCIVAIWEAKS